MDFKNFTVSPESPALDAFVITPGASELPQTPRAIMAGGAGTVTVTTWRGTSLTITLPAGGILPLVVTHVTAATATDLIGLV